MSVVRSAGTIFGKAAVKISKRLARKHENKKDHKCSSRELLVTGGAVSEDSA